MFAHMKISMVLGLGAFASFAPPPLCPGQEAVPVGQEAVPVGQEAVPVGQEAVPVGQEAVPVGLEAELVIAGDVAQISVQLLQELLIAHCLVVRDERVQRVERPH